jgi:hypothetical protein
MGIAHLPVWDVLLLADTAQLINHPPGARNTKGFDPAYGAQVFGLPLMRRAILAIQDPWHTVGVARSQALPTGPCQERHMHLPGVVTPTASLGMSVTLAFGID